MGWLYWAGRACFVCSGFSGRSPKLSLDELRARVWQAVEPQHQARLATLADEFAEAKSKDLGSDDPAPPEQETAE